MPPLPKRHHFVPEMLIRNFAADNGLVAYFDKTKPKLGVVLRNPRKILFEHHLYTRTVNGQRDVAQEEAYGTLENEAKPILTAIIDAARTEQTPNLTPEQRQIWDIFLYEQMRRVPDFHRTLFSETYFDEVLEESLTEFEAKFRPPTAAENLRLADPLVRQEIMKNALVDTLARPSSMVLEALAGRGLAVLIVHGSAELVLGSRPAAKLTKPGHTHLSDHEVELWLSIAPDVAVGIGRDPGTEMLIPIANEDVRHLNAAFNAQSSKLVARSRDALVQLIGASEV